ncbi:LPD29 domain-containing protein [Streptomyces sp. NPDC005395]|uniref:LPD29 domain-containing protein n=1 Tax=Streptomyces sp. NPDC005395 TaxID=3157042 RepID=UPI0033AB226C
MDDDSTPKARAARLRAALREAFDGHRFSVTSESRGRHAGWLTVKWDDGPTLAAVHDVAEPFRLDWTGVDTIRRFSADIGKQLDDIWKTADKARPHRAFGDGSGRFHEWQHDGHTVPAGTPWDQKAWLADHVVLPPLGQGAAMDPNRPAAEPDPEHDRPSSDEQPKTDVSLAAVQRRDTALALTRVMREHLQGLPDHWWEPVTDADQTGRLGVLVAGAVLAELSGLTAALAHLAISRNDADTEAAAGLAHDTIDRLTTAQNPVLKQVATLKEGSK